MARNDHDRNPKSPGFLGAAVDLVVATQSDTVDEPGGVSRGLLIDATGAISFITEKGTSVTIDSLAVGVIHPIRVKRVNDTGTALANADIFLIY